jgi:hypothetical protein
MSVAEPESVEVNPGCIGLDYTVSCDAMRWCPKDLEEEKLAPVGSVTDYSTVLYNPIWSNSQVRYGEIYSPVRSLDTMLRDLNVLE